MPPFHPKRSAMPNSLLDADAFATASSWIMTAEDRGTFIRTALPVVRLAIVLCLLGGLALLFETRFIYFPMRAHDATPGALGLAFEDVTLTTSDGVRLHGWYLPVPQARWVMLVS